MLLLFYSHESKLDEVPYEHFINAFRKDEEGTSQDMKTDDERAKIVRNFLSQIATSLL